MAPPVVQVDPRGFAKAADVYEGVHNALTYGIGTLTRILGRCGGSAGSDNAGRRWSNDYDPAAWNTVDALGDLALAVGQMHDLLQFTAANHANANSQSVPQPNPNDLVFPPGTLTVYQPTEPPPRTAATTRSPRDGTGSRAPCRASCGRMATRMCCARLLRRGGPWPTRFASRLPVATARELIEAQQSPETPQALEHADICQCRQKPVRRPRGRV